MYSHKNGIVLKKMDIEHLSLLFELKEESWYGTHNTAIMNWSDQKEWYDKIRQSKDDYVMIAYVGQEIVGCYKALNIHRINRSYDSAHDVFKKHRGKGYGFKVLEAGADFGFEILNINRLNSEVIGNNIASMKNAMKVGFQQEGVKKQVVYKCGEYLDSIVIGLTRDRWLDLDRMKAYNGCCNLDYTPTGVI